jgi:hypothetical protein
MQCKARYEWLEHKKIVIAFSCFLFGEDVVKNLWTTAMCLVALAAAPTAYAAETSQSLAAKIVAASERAEAQRVSVGPAVTEVIETSGATPIVISAAINSLLTQCPSGELMRELMKRPGTKVPSFCTEDSQAALRSLRTTALAQVGATGATGSIAGGRGLPSAPSGSAAGGGSDYQPVGGQ